MYSPEKIKILAVTANPDGSSNIRSDRISQAIKTGISTAEKSNIFEVKSELAASIDTFSIALEKHKPDLLHLIGHGNEISPFVFESSNGAREYSEVDPIAGQISLYVPKIKGVIITACHSFLLAEKLSQKVSFAFGKSKLLNRDHAELFTKWFYFYLASGNSIIEASNKTINRLANESISTDQIPSLISKDSNFRFLINPAGYSISQQLIRGSRLLFEKLFALETVEFIESPHIKVDEKSTFPIQEALDFSIEKNQFSVILTGGSNNQRSEYCYRLWKRFVKEEDQFTTIYISGKDLEKFALKTSSKSTIFRYIAWEYLKVFNPSDSFLESLRIELFSQTLTYSPKYLLILEGWERLNVTKTKVIEFLKDFNDAFNNQRTPTIITTDIIDESLDHFSYLEQWNLIPVVNDKTIETTIFILTATKDKIKLNYNNTLFKKIPSNRYHNSNLEYWRPFFQKNPQLASLTIEELLYQFRDKSGYRFECHFSNGQLPDNEYYELFQNIQKTIAIIDLLAISSENKELAKKFDTRMSGAVILPICSELKKKLKKIAEKNRTDLFKFFELSRKKNIFMDNDSTDGKNVEFDYIYDFYGRNSSDRYDFHRKLIEIFKRKFPIKNKLIKGVSFESENLRKMNFKNI